MTFFAVYIIYGLNVCMTDGKLFYMLYGGGLHFVSGAAGIKGNPA